MMKQAFVEMNKPVIIAVSPCINDALLTYRLNDSFKFRKLIKYNVTT